MLADAGVDQQIDSLLELSDLVAAADDVSDFPSNSVLITLTDVHGDTHALRLMGFSEAEFFLA